MVQLRLPKNSSVKKGKITDVSNDEKDTIILKVYRYNPDDLNEDGTNKNPYLETFILPKSKCGSMVLDTILYVKNHVDQSLTLRRSCREGVCGSCAMNIDGLNTLACTTSLSDCKDTITIYPLPHMNVIKDLVVDMENFYNQYHYVQPWLQNNDAEPDLSKERLQSPEDRKKLDNMYECILCACCSTACPSYWWNDDKYLGPAALLHANRWIVDSRDDATDERLDRLNDSYKLYRCHTIMNCATVCPKGLNPAEQIASIKVDLANS